MNNNFWDTIRRLAGQAATNSKKFVMGESAFEQINKMAADEEKARAARWEERMKRDPINTQLGTPSEEDK